MLWRRTKSRNAVNTSNFSYGGVAGVDTHGLQRFRRFLKSDCLRVSVLEIEDDGVIEILKKKSLKIIKFPPLKAKKK